MVRSPERSGSEEWNPDEILKYAGVLCGQLMTEIKKTRAILKAAEERGVTVEPSAPLRKFGPHGEHEALLIKMTEELTQLIREVSNATHRELTHSELQKRMLELDFES